MNRNTVNSVIIMGAIVIIGIIGIQAFLLVQTFDQEKESFQQKANIMLWNVAQKLAVREKNYNLPIRELVNQITPEYYVVNYNNNINANLLEYYLIKESYNVGMREDFEYGIYDSGSKRMVYGSYYSFDKNISIQKTKKRTDLPVYKKFDYYFGVRFPNRNKHLIYSMKTTILFTSILFLSILFFIYVIYVILKQKRLSELQKEFIDNMTHEFKTPISTIKISADVIVKQPEVQNNLRILRYGHIIQEQNERLNNQVEKVLQLARIEKDSFKLKFEKINLHELLVPIIKSDEIKIHERKGEFITILEATKPIIKADHLHLTNVIHNLLDNALKYTKSEPHITIATKNLGSKISLSISDNGMGISEDEIDRIFDKFYRVSTGNVHNVKGFGLGLFYVKNICQMHGWKIEVLSKQGEGTTFTIIINR
ncbi:MAG: HAMP domain-containing histidine kinase [Saprospiraceae bacterium]|nr:HAMP domain-containing histidine kinase [Saprospiraceae bacterium]